MHEKNCHENNCRPYDIVKYGIILGIVDNE